MVIHVESLTVHAWGARLLSQLSFSLDAGEVLAIIGPNGAGKSTLLNTLAGSEHSQQHTQGHIDCCGFLPSDRNPQIKAKHLAILPQQSQLNFPFTVEEVIQLSRIPHHTGKEIDQQIMKDVLVELDISHLRKRLYTQLSGGERQRVQLARVMSQIWRSEDANPRLLLLDEPTSSLDLGHQQQLMQVIKKFATSGVAVVMVLHDINLAINHADKVLALCCGELLAYGVPANEITPALMQGLYGVEVDVIEHPQSQQRVVIPARG